MTETVILSAVSALLAAALFDDGELKLRATGQGILQAAHTVARLGVKGKKELPEMLGEETDGEEGEDEEQN